MNVWAQVKVIGKDHPREGQAGTVFAVNPGLPGEVVVRFDLDDTRESVAVADLVAL